MPARISMYDALNQMPRNNLIVLIWSKLEGKLNVLG